MHELLQNLTGRVLIVHRTPILDSPNLRWHCCRALLILHIHFSYLLFAEGLKFFFCEEVICFKKHDDELTEEEHKQIKINDELRKQDGWYELDFTEKVAQGFKQVKEWWENHFYNQETKEYEDNLIEPLVERLENYALKED